LDQRRKFAAQQLRQELIETQLKLERNSELLGGIIATIKAGSWSAVDELVRIIRSGVDMSQAAAYVRNERRASAVVEKAYDETDFTMDGSVELPSPLQMQILTRITSRISEGDEADGRMDSGAHI